MSPQPSILLRLINAGQLMLFRIEMSLFRKSYQPMPPYPKPIGKPKRRYSDRLQLVRKTEDEKESEPYWPKKSKAKLYLVK